MSFKGFKAFYYAVEPEGFEENEKLDEVTPFPGSLKNSELTEDSYYDED